MEVACPPAIVDAIYDQLVRQNGAQQRAFSELVADYSAVLTRSRELQVLSVQFTRVASMHRVANAARAAHNPAEALGPQVRCAQLDKEASELRLENETLLRTVEDGKHAAVQSAQVGAATAAADAAQCALRCDHPAIAAPLKPLLPTPAHSLRRWRRGRSRCRMS